MQYRNKVQLLDYVGSDKRFCLSAWQSTTGELGIELPENIKDRVDVIFAYICKQKKKTPEQLLDALASDGHHTPFEKSYIDFQVTADVASHIHCLKHRISVSINAESARYKEYTDDKFYLPEDWVGITVSEHSRAKLSNNPIIFALGVAAQWRWFDMLRLWNEAAAALYHTATDDMRVALGAKRAKETTRYFLTYSTQLNFDVAFNFRSFMHFLSLRKKVNAQDEIHAIAAEMLRQVQSIQGEPFKLSLKAFGYETK